MPVDRDGWEAFIDLTRGREPREWLVRALKDAPPGAGLAIDLGCGAGNDTIHLLDHGYVVVALDSTRAAVRMTHVRAMEAGHGASLNAVVGPFESLRPAKRSAALIHAGFSLPFSDPRHFDALWQAIFESLVSGGLFVGQLFGDRDEWADKGGEVAHVFHTRKEVERLIDPFERVALEEVERDGQVADGTPKHWHVFHMILRRA